MWKPQSLRAHPFGGSAVWRTCKEEEDAVAHGAEHGSEALPDDKGEQHVGGHVDACASRTRLQGLNLPAARNPLVSFHGEAAHRWQHCPSGGSVT